jgi:hypothetical protein
LRIARLDVGPLEPLDERLNLGRVGFRNVVVLGHRRWPRRQSRPRAGIGQVGIKLKSLCHAALPQGHGSLNFCLKSHPALVLKQADAIFDLAVQSGRVAYLQQLFSVLKQFPQERGGELLSCLSQFAEKPFFKNIQSDAALTELAATLKVAAGQNPRLALHISKQLPPQIASVAKAQASIYMNIAHKCDDLAILNEILAEFAEILQVKDLYGSKIRNALGNALPLLDHKLGGRKVAEMILSVCQKVGHERSLEDLMRAAIRVPNMTGADISALLKLNIPEPARGILLRTRKPHSH